MVNSNINWLREAGRSPLLWPQKSNEQLDLVPRSLQTGPWKSSLSSYAQLHLYDTSTLINAVCARMCSEHIRKAQWITQATLDVLIYHINVNLHTNYLPVTLHDKICTFMVGPSTWVFILPVKTVPLSLSNDHPVCRPLRLSVPCACMHWCTNTPTCGGLYSNYGTCTVHQYNVITRAGRSR